MRWKGRRRSTNVDDRRAQGPAGRGLAIGGGLGLVLILAAMFIGGDLGKLLGEIGQSSLQNKGTTTQGEFKPTPEEEETVARILTVLADTEDVWHAEFRKLGKAYAEPTLVLFRGSVKSACGVAGSQVGPFYCPADKQVYIDVSFFQMLEKQLGAGGDFAQAYVLAHEIGHHVQNLLGTSDRLHSARGRVGEPEYNRLSVRLELQADFYAGLFTHHAQQATGFLERGDLEEAINAAQKIGDDALQRRGGGEVRPDSFTHGSSQQRMAWFQRGFETGDLRAGDTFDDAVFNRVSPR